MKFFKEYGFYQLGVFLLFIWVIYKYIFIGNLNNLTELASIIIVTFVFVIVTVFLPYLAIYSKITQSFINKILKSNKAKKITYYMISIAANFYVIFKLIEIYDKYNS